MQRSIRTTLLAGAGLAALMSAAQAQQAPAQGQQAQQRVQLEEIVVTARKIEENLQAIPVSVTAFSADRLERLNAQGLRDIARFTSGFSFENFSGAFSAPVIRGQSQTRIDLLVQNVASFFNGVYLQRGYMVDTSLLDVERVEIIKGPQSALYGRNAFSGAINYITKRPGDEFEGSASVTVGTDKRFDVKGSISGPIIQDRVGIVAAAGLTKFDGTWENQHALADQGTFTKGNLGGFNNKSFLLGAVITPTDAITLDVSYSHTDVKIESAAQYSMGTTGALAAVNGVNCSPLPPVAGGAIQNRLLCGEIPVLPTLQPGENRKPGLLQDPRSFGQRGGSDLVSARAEWAITDAFALNYLFGFTRTDVSGRGSPARNPEIGIGVPFTPAAGRVGFDSQPNGLFRSMSHEARVEWTPGGIVRRALFGGFYSDAEDDASAWSRWAPPLSLAEDFSTFTFQNQGRVDEVKSVFGLVTLDVTERLSVTGEVRYTDETLKLKVRQLSPGFVTQLFDRNSPILRTQTNSFDYATPRLAIDYQVTEENLVYFSVGKGVKSGGQNVPGADPQQDVYDPEKNWTYEIGSKNTFFDGRLRANLSAFYIDWTGIQGSVARNYPNSGRILGVNCFTACALPAPGTPVPVIIGNLGDATVKGLEFDGQFLATDALSFDYSLSYVDSKYKDGQISPRIVNARSCDGIVCPTSTFDAQGRPLGGASIGGKQVERAPSWKAAVGAQYEWTTPGLLDLEWYVRGDVTYQSKQYADEINLAWVPSRLLVDASIGVSRGAFSARLWAKNVFDKKYVSSAFFIIGGDGPRSVSYVPFIGERRTVGLTLTARL